ncbi:hypothetical protein Cob_v001317 [Colletotrichum orbiculare MAFF 240422]|uniref:Uncharacterized protein n=1 Tax=Colletotrichum orbiculare (strain 104-T / ATCC 96160 / CBS 514.97 / LARS 414 / MAFF 240422) TaxID=1213857 RepID=N4VKZ7_COLOR|nr:hypothetical protein Cob_v001317 [Colletotrichum orbiculare MAFF 240422]
MRLSAVVIASLSWTTLAPIALSIAVREPGGINDVRPTDHGTRDQVSELHDLATGDTAKHFTKDLSIVTEHTSELAPRFIQLYNFRSIVCARNAVAIVAMVVAARAVWDTVSSTCKVFMSNKDFKYDALVRLSDNGNSGRRLEVTIKAATCNTEYVLSYIREGGSFKFEVGSQPKAPPGHLIPPQSLHDSPLFSSPQHFHTRRLEIGDKLHHVMSGSLPNSA